MGGFILASRELCRCQIPGSQSHYGCHDGIVVNWQCGPGYQGDVGPWYRVPGLRLRWNSQEESYYLPAVVRGEDIPVFPTARVAGIAHLGYDSRDGEVFNCPPLLSAVVSRFTAVDEPVIFPVPIWSGEEFNLGRCPEPARYEERMEFLSSQLGRLVEITALVNREEERRVYAHVFLPLSEDDRRQVLFCHRSTEEREPEIPG